MESMYENFFKLKSLDLKSFNAQNVTDMEKMSKNVIP